MLLSTFESWSKNRWRLQKMYVPLAKLMRRKSVAAIRSAGRTAGLTNGSMIFSIFLFSLFFFLGSKAGHFKKFLIFLGMVTRSFFFWNFLRSGPYDFY